MKPKQCLVIYLTFFVVCYHCKCEEDSLTSNQSCVFNVTDCNYTLTLVPGQNCRAGPATKRVRRSYDIKDVPFTEKSHDENLEVLATRMKKLENKMTKEMKALSTRVLRGARRMENMFTELISKQSKRTMKSYKHICPPGFDTVDSWTHCYLMSRFNTTWYEAQDYCLSFNSEMLSLDTLKEHYVVTFLIKNTPEYQETVGWWTSGTFVAASKRWMWTSDEEKHPFTFIKWASGEPNETSSQCMLLSKADNHLWNDAVCTQRFNFICQVPIGE